MSIKLEHLNYVYSAGTAYEKQALKDVMSGDSARRICRDHRSYRIGQIHADSASEWTDQGDIRCTLL